MITTILEGFLWIVSGAIGGIIILIMASSLADDPVPINPIVLILFGIMVAGGYVTALIAIALLITFMFLDYYF